MMIFKLINFHDQPSSSGPTQLISFSKDKSASFTNTEVKELSLTNTVRHLTISFKTEPTIVKIQLKPHFHTSDELRTKLTLQYAFLKNEK